MNTLLLVSLGFFGLRAPLVADPSPFQIVELGSGVYAAVVRPEVPSFAFSNSLFVVGEDGVLVVDTQQSPIAAAAVLSGIRAVTRLPVRWLVYTHRHGDHLWGSETYLDAFPEIEIVAHSHTAAYLRVEGETLIHGERARLDSTTAELRSRFDAGVPPEEVDRYEAALSLRARQLEALGRLRLALPTRTVDSALRIDLGGRTVEVMHLGAAHTPGDLVVHVPEVGVLAVGDLAERGEPWTADADIEGWIRVLGQLEAWGPRVVVPGHGAPGGTELLRMTLRALRTAPRSP